MEVNEEKTVDGNELRDLLRKARLFMECSPLKKVEAKFGCLDRDKICSDIDVALAKPRRNYEVGSPEEQAERFHKFCMDNSSEIQGMCRSSCPCIDSGDKCHCLCKWEQMPYEEKERGNECRR